MESYISAAEAARAFSEVIERVRSGGEVFVVERAGEPMCRIVPVTSERATVRELVLLLRATPCPDDGFLDAVEEATRDQTTLTEPPWER